MKTTTMISRSMLAILLAAGSGTAGLAVGPIPAAAQAPVRIVATLPVYAELTEEVGGDQVSVESIANPNEDSHFVRPKPSFAMDVRRAELFITTGLDLELWAPTVLDRAGNSQVLEGGKGYVSAHTGITLLDIPSSTDRSAGDVHIYGNPHLTTDPLRALQVARNITVGLKRVAPDRSAVWDQGLQDLTTRMYDHLFGDRLVELAGGPALEQLALSGGLHDFLETQQYQGQPLLTQLGGWLGKMEPYRGRRMVCYHKNWAYLEDRFGVTCAEYVEAKPGIPPTPGHVAQLIDLMQNQNIRVMLVASYFPQDQVQTVARRAGAVVVRAPMQPGAMPGSDDYFAMVDTWVNGLVAAFQQTGD
jgi:zinc/manganese transport system substrate-binding protein